jgi:hypothetical protein
MKRAFDRRSSKPAVTSGSTAVASSVAAWGFFWSIGPETGFMQTFFLAPDYDDFANNQADMASKPARFGA